jgi:hypothetical protein
LACLVLEKNQYEVFLASLNTLTNCKSCSKSRIQFLFRLSFVLIGQFFLLYIHSWLQEQFSESEAGSEQLLKAQAATSKPEQAQ